jgi:hypothetical protein
LPACIALLACSTALLLCMKNPYSRKGCSQADDDA